MTAATIGGLAQLLAAASPMMTQPKINVTISQISSLTISGRKRRMDTRQWGQPRQRMRGGASPGNNAPIADDDDNANNHNNAASSYRRGVEGWYKDNANYYNRNEDRGECKIWLSCSLKEIDLWKVQYMELREEQRCSGGNENHNGGGVGRAEEVSLFQGQGWGGGGQVRGGGLSSIPGEVGPPQHGQRWLFWQ